MPQSRTSRRTSLVLHLTYFVSGIVTVLIGQVLPILAKRFSLGDLDVSYLFPAQFTGSLTGTLLSSWFGRRDRYFAAVFLGALLMAAGVLLMNVDSFAVCLGAFAITGVGIGLTLPSINMLVLAMHAERPAAALSVLNFCWGLGAILSKPFVDLFAGERSLGLTIYILSVPLIICALALIRRVSDSPAADALAADEPDGGEAIPIWTTAAAWLMALFNFVHVGFESGMGGWLTTYTGRLAGEPIARWVSPTLLYFSLFLLGRAIAPALFRLLSESQMLGIGLVLMLGGVTVMLAAASVQGLSVGALVAGFGTSWVFPTNVARFSRTFGPRAGRRATPLFLFGTLGAAASTWLIGFISAQTGSLRSGMYVLLAAVVLLLVLQLTIARTRPSRVSQNYLVNLL